MIQKLAITLAAAALFAAPVLAQTPPAGGSATQPGTPAPGKMKGRKGGDRPHPACTKIAKACKAAGFIPGDWKKGDGLWRDCVDPIIQGVTNVPGGTKPLPTVDPKIVATCKKNHPKYGEGKVGSTTP